MYFSFTLWVLQNQSIKLFFKLIIFKYKYFIQSKKTYLNK